MPEPFDICGTGVLAVGTDAGVMVSFAGHEGEARMFRRRAQRLHGNGTTEAVEMLVAELDGVRVYFHRDTDTGRLDVVISRLDLQP